MTENLEGVDRYDSVVEYLRTSINKLVNVKMTTASRKHRIDPSTVSSRLVDVLKSALSSEREQHLEQLMLKLAQLQSEKSRLEVQLKMVKGGADRETERYLQENSQLKERYSQLEDELKTIEHQHSVKEQMYREELKKKRDELGKLRKIIEVAQNTQQELTQEAKQLKQVAEKMQRNQIRLLRRAKDLCLEHLTQTLSEENEKETQEQATQLSNLTSILKHEKLQQAKNERRCQQLLDAIWAMRSDADHPDITPADFTKRLPELKVFVENALDYHRRLAVDSLKEEVKRAIPDIEFGDGETVIESVQKYIDRKVREKEGEYERVLKRGEEREKRLRDKVQASLGKVQDMEPRAGSDDDILADLDNMKREWELRKRQLDEKMKAIKSRTCCDGE